MKNNLHFEIEKILDNTDFGLVLNYTDDKKERAKRDKIYEDCINQLLTLIKKHERDLIGEDENKCVNGKPHKWRTGSTDSGMETYCTKCFLNGLVPQSRNKLRAEQRAKLKDPSGLKEVEK